MKTESEQGWETDGSQESLPTSCPRLSLSWPGERKWGESAAIVVICATLFMTIAVLGGVLVWAYHAMEALWR